MLAETTQILLDIRHDLNEFPIFLSGLFPTAGHLATLLVLTCFAAAFAAAIRPQSFPFLASKLARAGFAPLKSETIVVISIPRAHFPEGAFAVKITCGKSSSSTGLQTSGRFDEALYLTLHRWESEVAISVTDVEGETVGSSVVSIKKLLRGGGLSVELESPLGGTRKRKGKKKRKQRAYDIFGAVEVVARVPPSVRTPLLRSLGKGSLGNPRLQAAVAQATTEEEDGTAALAAALVGPLGCLGTNAKYARVERPGGRLTLAFYEKISPDGGPLGKSICSLMVASISKVAHNGPGCFKVYVKDGVGQLKELDFHAEPAACEVWAGGLRALSMHAKSEESPHRAAVA